MKKIEAYKTRDGKVFDSKSEATNHEITLRRDRVIHNWCKAAFTQHGNDREYIVKELQEHLMDLVNKINQYIPDNDKTCWVCGSVPVIGQSGLCDFCLHNEA